VIQELNKDDIVKNEIIKAAENVFQKYGLNKSTMEDIAREAGKGKSTLYYYFQSKDEIFDTVIDIELNYVITKAWESTIDSTSAKEKMKKYIVTSITELKNYVKAFNIVKAEMKRNYGFLEKMRKKFEPREEALVKSIFQHGVKQGECNFANEEELNAATKAAVGIIHALELYLLLENDDLAQIDIVAKLITTGI
jgi:AcrR family transcriptional regulator